MTLKRRLILHIAVLVAGVLLLGVAAVLGVSSLHQDFSLALRANEQLRQTYTIGQYVAAARSDLAQSSPALAAVELRRAVGQYEIAAEAGWLPSTEAEAAAVRAALESAQGGLSGVSPDPSLLDRSYAALADLSAATRRAIESRQSAATRRHHLTLYTVAGLAVLLALAACVAASRLYRSVMRPLGTLREVTRQLTPPHDLTARAPTDAVEEFASLAADFNRMADELQAVYTDLENRVEAKSRQLARSERLASVGYLAAGVAHEINNPLAVIAGFAERSIQRLSRGPATDATVDQVRKALQAISDESFRCKQITTRLLELSRPGVSARTVFSLSALAADVLASVGGLPRFGSRRASLDGPEDPADTAVNANEGEIRQVVLNLLINAMEATDAVTGQITVRLIRTGRTVELLVEDDGRGIDAGALPHLFEPFFSDKRADRPGTGLGLSIAHSIVTDHAGSLDAYSAGVGRGARFTMRLPAYVPETSRV